jgi:chromosome segregation ATPase
MFLNENNVETNEYSDMSMDVLSESINEDIFELYGALTEGMIEAQELKQELIIAEHFSILKEDETILEGKLESAIKTIKEQLKKMKERVKKLFNTVMGKIKEYIGKMKDMFSKVGEKLKKNVDKGKLAIALKTKDVTVERFKNGLKDAFEKDSVKAANVTSEKELKSADEVIKAFDAEQKKFDMLVDRQQKLQKEVDEVQKTVDQLESKANSAKDEKAVKELQEKKSEADDKLKEASLKLKIVNNRLGIYRKNMSALDSIATKAMKVKEDSGNDE